MDAIDLRILNDFQREFPLISRPYAEIADRIGLTEGGLLERIDSLRKAGMVSRVGVVFRPNVLGASTLAAMAVPEHRMEDVARYVSSLPEVNHNYQREHPFNLWFVANARNPDRLDLVLRMIESYSDVQVMALPLREDYYVDLGFDLTGEPTYKLRQEPPRRSAVLNAGRFVQPLELHPAESALVSVLQRGFPLFERPYAEMGAKVGMPEEQVILRLRDWLRNGFIRRIGVVVRHHELGFQANAMVVWDIPDSRVSYLGRKVGNMPFVTLSYCRARHLPEWPYNLYCMIHGRDREVVLGNVEMLREQCGLRSYLSEILFSRRRFKQEGARYMPEPAPAPVLG